MRRWVSGMRFLGDGVVSWRGWGRLLLGVMVGYEGDDGVGFELFAAAQVGQLYKERYACYRAAGVLDELAHGAGCAARGEQVVCHEAAGTGREDTVVGDALGSLGEGVHSRMKGVTVFYKGGYVLERDARPRVIRDGVDVVQEYCGGFSCPARGSSHGAKVSSTFAIISSLMRESTAARWRALFMASPTRPSSPLRSSGLRTCLNRAASRSTAAMMPRRWRGCMEYLAISRAMRAISASRCVSSPLRPITPTLISSSTKRISVSRVSASSSRVYVLSSRTLERSPAASPAVKAAPPSIRFFITLSGRYSLSWSVRIYLRSSISWEEKSL